MAREVTPVVLWCDTGANQKALAHKVASRFGLAGLVVEKRERAKRSFPATVKRVAEKLLAGDVDDAWARLLARYEASYPQFPDVPTRAVENVNTEATVELTTSVGAGLVMVSGTRIVREPLLSLPLAIGIVNLHTGLSPYVKGGPNCTNWCLAKGDYHLIGNTVMWIDAGIDSGNLITTRTVDFSGGEDLDAIQWRVMEDAHALYLEAVARLLERPDRRPSVQQATLAEGKTYYNRMWGVPERRSLQRNLASGAFRRAVQSGEVQEKRRGLRTISLD